MSGFTRAAVVPALLALVAACSDPTQPTDTGYTGTWGRGTGRVRSLLAIAKVGERYRCRLTLRSDDGGREIACDWDGRCVETVGGTASYELHLRTWTDEASGRLRLEVVATPATADHQPAQYIDELVVEPGGRTLTAYTIESNHVPYPETGRPRRELSKVSDGVAGRPR